MIHAFCARQNTEAGPYMHSRQSETTTLPPDMLYNPYCCTIVVVSYLGLHAREFGLGMWQHPVNPLSTRLVSKCDCCPQKVDQLL
jgi:hypothetical protein